MAQHAERVAQLSLAVARALGADREVQCEVELVALLHDLGKCVLPRAILEKPSALSADEWRDVREHTVVGQRMLRVIDGLPDGLGDLVRATHERFDGAGYPDRLAGEAIPLAARIVFCVDAYDAMTSARPYQAAMPCPAALAELERCARRQFDPAVVAALVQVLATPAGRPLALAG